MFAAAWFIRLADGAYQHGNLFVIPRASLQNERAWRPLDRIYRARKNGLLDAAGVAQPGAAPERFGERGALGIMLQPDDAPTPGTPARDKVA